MKTKLFVAAMAVAFSMTVASCNGNKTTTSTTTTETSDSVKTVETAMVACAGTSAVCCQGDSVCAKSCDKAQCNGSQCNKANCNQDCNQNCKEKCDKGANCQSQAGTQKGHCGNGKGCCGRK